MADFISKELDYGYVEARLVERPEEPAPYLNVTYQEFDGGREASVNLWFMEDGSIVATPEGRGPESGETLTVREPE